MTRRLVNDNLKAYGESGRDDNLGKGREQKKKTTNMQKIIHMEFNTDDDVEEQLKNANDVKVEGKVQVRKNMVHYYEFIATTRKESAPTRKKL